MKLPTLTQAAKGTAAFLRYEDGALWYHLDWHESDVPYVAHSFEFPIPTNAPDIERSLSDAIQMLRDHSETYSLAGTNAAATCLAGDLEQHKKRSAGAGQFLPEDKAIRFLRWIRLHLDYVQSKA